MGYFIKIFIATVFLVFLFLIYPPVSRAGGCSCGSGGEWQTCSTNVDGVMECVSTGGGGDAAHACCDFCGGSCVGGKPGKDEGGGCELETYQEQVCYDGGIESCHEVCFKNRRGEETCSNKCYTYEAYCEWQDRQRCKTAPPPCVPSCGSPLCGQANGCGGACANTDANNWGAWSACSVSCGGGTQTRTNACGTLDGRTCNTQSCQGPWWQVNDGDITSSGDIVSYLPSGKYLNTVGSGGFPGIPVYNGQIGTAPGTISSTGWNANTETSLTRIFNYSYFENLIPPDIVINDISKLTTGVGAVTDANGYEWYKITGNLDTVGNIDFGSRKVILFVKSGNFNINAKINLDDNNGFFVVFVNGNINIAASVTGTPSLEGMYTADSGFTTGLGTTQLHLRGSVASYGGITLQRDLPDDTTIPAELFEFAPDQVVLFPQKLMFKRFKWAEVAP